jgi:hypothetical protein
MSETVSMFTVILLKGRIPLDGSQPRPFNFYIKQRQARLCAALVTFINSHPNSISQNQTADSPYLRTGEQVINPIGLSNAQPSGVRQHPALRLARSHCG